MKLHGLFGIVLISMVNTSCQKTDSIATTETGGQAKVANGDEASSPPRTQQQETAANVVDKKTAKHSSGLVVEILSVSRDDTREQLKVTWRYTNPTKKAIRILKTDSMPNLATVEGHAWQKYWNGVKYTEVAGPAGNKTIIVHQVAKTNDGVIDGTEIRSKGIEVPAEGEVKMFARFSVPQKGVDHINLKLPEIEEFEDLSIDGAR